MHCTPWVHTRTCAHTHAPQDESSAPTLDELGISDLAVEEGAAATFQPEVEV